MKTPRRSRALVVQKEKTTSLSPQDTLDAMVRVHGILLHTIQDIKTRDTESDFYIKKAFAETAIAILQDPLLLVLNDIRKAYSQFGINLQTSDNPLSLVVDHSYRDKNRADIGRDMLWLSASKNAFLGIETRIELNKYKFVVASITLTPEIITMSVSIEDQHRRPVTDIQSERRYHNGQPKNQLNSDETIKPYQDFIKDFVKLIFDAASMKKGAAIRQTVLDMATQMGIDMPAGPA